MCFLLLVMQLNLNHFIFSSEILPEDPLPVIQQEDSEDRSGDIQENDNGSIDSSDINNPDQKNEDIDQDLPGEQSPDEDLETDQDVINEPDDDFEEDPDSMESESSEDNIEDSQEDFDYEEDFIFNNEYSEHDKVSYEDPHVIFIDKQDNETPEQVLFIFEDSDYITDGDFKIYSILLLSIIVGVLLGQVLYEGFRL